RIGAVADLVRAVLASHKTDDIALVQVLLALCCAQRGRSPDDEEPLLVRVMSVVRPEPISGLELVHASTDELGADARADPRVLGSPARPLLVPVPVVSVEIEDLHGESLDGRRRCRRLAVRRHERCPYNPGPVLRQPASSTRGAPVSIGLLIGSWLHSYQRPS